MYALRINKRNIFCCFEMTTTRPRTQIQPVVQTVGFVLKNGHKKKGLNLCTLVCGICEGEGTSKKSQLNRKELPFTVSNKRRGHLYIDF